MVNRFPFLLLKEIMYCWISGPAGVVPAAGKIHNVVKAYQQFHDKGFDIFGVSLDDTKADWLAAIKKDGLNWTQVSDLKGWNADVVSLYGIKAIPMNFLLDKNGIIVARGLRGDELE